MDNLYPIQLMKAAVKQRLSVWREIVSYARDIRENPSNYNCELTGWRLKLHAVDVLVRGTWTEILASVHFIAVIWIAFFFPNTVGEEEGELLCQVDGSFSSAPPDCQSSYYSAGNWDEWHVTGWRLNYLNMDNY